MNGQAAKKRRRERERQAGLALREGAGRGSFSDLRPIGLLRTCEGSAPPRLLQIAAQNDQTNDAAAEMKMET